jgi:flagellar biosynthesis/type III secretory pathway chaperone
VASSMVELISLLDVNEKVLAELASALTEEQNCIVDMDLERLTENGGRKEAIMTRLIKVREECRVLMQQAGFELGLKEIPSLSALIAACASSEQMMLRPVQRRLVWLSQTLERQHDMNRRMLENSIAMVKSSMALFGRLLGGCDTYGAQGHIESGRASGSILRQEI